MDRDMVSRFGNPTQQGERAATSAETMNLNESIVENAALQWFGELAHTFAHGPDLAPGEPAAEREGFGDVVLVGRFREAIRR